MTVAEKRDLLHKHCEHHACSECALHGKSVCNCGYDGHYFDRVLGKDGYMTVAEVIGAYEIVFGSTEEITCELDTTDVDDTITISGLKNIKNISINFKEEN